jgi:hypothetical protein
MDQDYIDRLRQIKKHIPNLFGGYDIPSGTPLLYIGCNARRMDYLPELYAAGYEITVLEIDPDNLASLEGDVRIKHLVLGDMRNAANLTLPHARYSVVFAWHVLEHVSRGWAELTLQQLESIATRFVVIGTPWGSVAQGVVGGNVHERHLSYWTPQAFVNLGYRADAIGTKNVLGSNILAWKELQ